MAASIRQSKIAAAGPGATSVTCTLDSAGAAGGIVLARVRTSDMFALLTFSANWTVIDHLDGSGECATILKADATVTVSLTVTQIAATNLDAVLVEVSGLGPYATVVDKTNKTNAGTQVATLATGTTGALAQAAEIAFAMISLAAGSGGSNTVDSGFTLDVNQSPNRMIGAYKITSATTALNPTFTWLTNRNATGMVVTLLAAAVTATLAAPLGALTSTATATPKVIATLAAPLGGLSATAAATPKVLATLAAPLGPLTATATATPKVVATLAAPLGALVSTATATPKVQAALAAPLGPLAATATADVTSSAVEAVLSAPLGGLAASASATPRHPATLAAPLGPLQSTVTAKTGHPALLNAPLGGLVATAAGTVGHASVFAAPLGGLTATVTAVPTVHAVLSAPLGGLTASIRPVRLMLVAAGPVRRRWAADTERAWSTSAARSPWTASDLRREP